MQNALFKTCFENTSSEIRIPLATVPRWIRYGVLLGNRHRPVASNSAKVSHKTKGPILSSPPHHTENGHAVSSRRKEGRLGGFGGGKRIISPSPSISLPLMGL